MKLIERSLGRERRTKLALAVLLCGGGTVSFLYFHGSNLVLATGITLVSAGMWLLWETLKRRKRKQGNVWHLLNNQPDQIVWIYSLRTETMPFGLHLWNSGVMYFNLLDGRELTLSLPANKLKMVSKFLNRLLPDASFGYSAERKRLFEKDPALLLRTRKT